MRSVLLIDDDELMLRSLQRSLAAKGYEVRLASGPEAAFELIPAVDVVVSDIRMPGLSGIDLLRELRRRNCTKPVILMTGAPELETAMAAVEFGAVHYLTKPFGIDMLKAVIDRAVVSRVVQPADLKLLGDLRSLDARFDEALAHMFMVFQPIVSVARRKPIAYESLLRTNEATLKNPMAFLAAAEHLKRLPELGRKVRSQVATHIADAPSDVDAFVNLHPRDIADPTLYDPASPLSQVASRVVLELTEREGLEGIDNVPDRLARLRQLGFRIAVDDLGAGYAGLSSVATLAPDVIKLDITLIRGIQGDARRQRMVASLAGLFRELETPTVVEGVETADERDAVSNLGADIMQGYLFARPQQGFVSVPPGVYGDEHVGGGSHDKGR
jgi:EAL domain-containing protein (putative c-di-GMP-specific phosphodiesterase class I)